MPSEPLDFGTVEHIKADALGEPGRRTFRLRIAGDAGAAQLWMEKEQLQALAMAIDQMLAQLRTNKIGRPESNAAASESGDFPLEVGVDFRVGRLGLGYDDEKDLLVVLAHEQEADEDGPPSLTCRVSRGKMKTLSAEIGAVIAAGRPRCPLCGAPITPGAHHACPGSNGRTPHPISGTTPE